jgi:hypothetical protein
MWSACLGPGSAILGIKIALSPFLFSPPTHWVGGAKGIRNDKANPERGAQARVDIRINYMQFRMRFGNPSPGSMSIRSSTSRREDS